MKLSLFIAMFQLGLVISCVAADSTISDVGIHQDKTWCVVAPGAPNNKLQAFLDSACRELNCQDIRPGGKCYQPNTLQNHASYVLNLYLRAKGECKLDIGLVTVANPSFGSCQYA